jgi:phosphoribosyl-AMP cyclohydrolase
VTPAVAPGELARVKFERKGDSSGHVQETTRIRVDCDGHAVLYTVRQTGPACHTGARSCFAQESKEP